ncbi:MAG: Uma2 family endonuclease [Oscillospiraceae bacterium]|nr:Uma2 family endonuclease [Oscillospiraceae bacterium]
MNERIEQIDYRKIKKEMIDGQIYLMATPSIEHRDVQYNMTNLFNEYFKRNKRRCRAIIDHELSIDEKNYLEPDIKILCREKKNDDIPVIIIEVLSKSTRERDLGVKMQKYAELGIKEYWVITWETSAVDTYLLNENKTYILHKSYVHLSSEEESKLKRFDENELKNIAKEFSPLSFPELIIKLEDVFDIFE